MEDGTPLLVFGDFNIHLEKPYATDFHSLLASFDLKRLTTTSTHKSGNQLDLIYTRDCTADNILVQPLHISDHFFIKFTLHFATRVPPTPLPVTFRRNLRSLSPSHLSSVVSSSLPSPTNFSSLDVNAATDTLCSTLTSCLDDICPLSSRPARTAPSNPWLSDVLCEHRTRLRAAERKWRKSNEPSDLSMYQSFLSSFSAEVHTAKSSHFHNNINNAPDMRDLFRTFNSLLCPPSPPPTTSITADDFATFFTNKTKTISSQFSPPLTQDPQPTRSTAQTPIFSFCPLPALTHIINTSLLTGIFPTAFKQARVTPLLKKPTLNTSLLENYRPVFLLPFIARSHCFFHRTTNWTLNSQVSGVAIQLRLRYSRSLKPCELQKPIPNHQSSFCWICLPLLTLSIIRSSCPPSHHWISLGFHFAGLNPISLVGLSGWPGEGRYPKHINWSL